MAPRGAGDSSSERIASPSRSRSNVRPSPTVPDTITATQRMPAVTGAGGRASPTTKAKLKISTTTTARKVMVARISRLRHSMRRSLAAMRRAWARNPGGAGTGADAEGSGTRAPFVDRAQRLDAEAARAVLVEGHPAPAQHHRVLGDGAGGVEVVGHQHHDPAGVALG